MKVVIEIATGKLVYWSDPPFEEGYGIINAVAMFGGKPEDYEEVEMTQAQYDANPVIAAELETAEIEAKIAERMDKNARDQAVAELKAEEEIPEAYQPKISIT